MIELYLSKVTETSESAQAAQTPAALTRTTPAPATARTQAPVTVATPVVVTPVVAVASNLAIKPLRLSPRLSTKSIQLL